MKNFLAPNIKTLRRKKELSQGELAVVLDITRNKIASYERGNSEPRLSILLSFAEYFRVSVDDLLSQDLSDEEVLIKSRKAFLQSSSDANTPLQIDGETQISLKNEEAIQEFVRKNQQIDKMLQGYKAFLEIRQAKTAVKNTEPPLLSAHNLLSVLEYLLKTNKELISSLAKTQ